MVLFQRKKRYSKISYEKRLSLIELVQNQKLSISKAAKRLHIKVPTAKVILSNYRKKGKILQKKIILRENEALSVDIKKEEGNNSIVVIPREQAQEKQPQVYYWLFYPLLDPTMLYYVQ